ncbi:hypothetical protein [Streptomyces sp. Y1]|uniref:HTTM domain-containing protein n=1 Tax=Streptomyces sp. Y1 TaxID=3238634 RepID=A0AB39TV09_9ACTN
MPSRAFTAAVCCLVLALAWRAGLVLLDHRAVRRGYPGAGAYRVGRGWSGPDAWAGQCRRALVGLAAAAVLLPVAVLPASRAAAGAALLACGTAGAWILLDRAPRFTGVCLLVLLALVAVREVGVLAGVLAGGEPSAARVGFLASFFAAQMYLVAGLRKVRSPQFMSGRVLMDNIAYNAWQAAAGSREFLPVPSLPRLAVALDAPVFRAACRAAAVATAGVELTLGLGALGLFPGAVTVLLAVPAHLAFTAISPRRIVPFSAASLGLLLLAASHPLLSGPGW